MTVLDRATGGSRLRMLLLAAAIGCVAAIVVLSLLPAREMVRTGAPKLSEHFFAYMGTGAIWTLALCGGIRTHGRVVLGLGLLAALMECGQYVSPGRTPHVSDLVSGTGGAALGVFLAALVTGLPALRRHLG